MAILLNNTRKFFGRATPRKNVLSGEQPKSRNSDTTSSDTTSSDTTSTSSTRIPSRVERISELPFFGPEEQIRKYIFQHQENLTDELKQRYLTQYRVSILDDIFQRQLIWSYDKPLIGEAYFWWDWCPAGEEGETNYWQVVEWNEDQAILERDIDRFTNISNADGTFSYSDFNGYTNDIKSGDEMLLETTYKSKTTSDDNPYDNFEDNLIHGMMRDYIEVSEWLGDGAATFGSHNGFVSRKMSLCWLFDAIRALINWKLNHTDKYAQEDIDTLNIDEGECFLTGQEKSPCGIIYQDDLDLDQINGRCQKQSKKRATNPDKEGTLIVRGNAWFYGERADFYTHNSFMGECRFFHNTRFLGQATFDKEINGTAMRSRWADLAEFREADGVYAPGTLVMFGGEKEITLSDGRHANAIVTTNPGLILNGDADKSKRMVGIALSGTVPVKVAGTVKKFDRLVPSKKYPGCAKAKGLFDWFKKPIGIALTDSADGKVQCITKMEF